MVILLVLFYPTSIPQRNHFVKWQEGRQGCPGPAVPVVISVAEKVVDVVVTIVLVHTSSR